MNKVPLILPYVRDEKCGLSKKICIQTTSQQQNHIKSYNGKLKMIEQYYLLFLMIICVPFAHIGDGINAQDPGISSSLSNSWCFILYHPKISVL